MMRDLDKESPLPLQFSGKRQFSGRLTRTILTWSAKMTGSFWSDFPKIGQNPRKMYRGKTKPVQAFTARGLDHPLTACDPGPLLTPLPPERSSEPSLAKSHAIRRWRGISSSRKVLPPCGMRFETRMIKRLSLASNRMPQEHVRRFAKRICQA